MEINKEIKIGPKKRQTRVKQRGAEICHSLGVEGRLGARCLDPKGGRTKDGDP